MRIIKIGKAESNDIYKPFENDPTVSRDHCQIFVDDQGNKFLTDLKSTNGTFVNNNRVTDPVLLKSFDIVRAGNSLVKWKEFLMNSKKDLVESDLGSQKNFSNSKNNSNSAKKSYWWIIILIIIFVLFIVLYNSKEESSTSSNKLPKTEIKKKSDSGKTNTVTPNNIERSKKTYPRPKNGHSPYDEYFGKGIYDNSSGNVFVIKNSNSSDAVVLLVNAFTKKKIRNEYIRKGDDFPMTGVPNGTYYIEWFSGNDWSPKLKVGSKYQGGFQSNPSFTKTKDVSDWMKVDGYYKWTITLYTVSGGDVDSEKIDANDFFK